MPTYDYLCSKCGHEFELFQQMTDPVKKKCPECGKLALRRLIGTGAGVIFKGSGFYETDYRSESYKKSAEKESGSSDKKEKKETKETKPAAKDASSSGSSASKATSNGDTSNSKKSGGSAG